MKQARWQDIPLSKKDAHNRIIDAAIEQCKANGYPDIQGLATRFEKPYSTIAAMLRAYDASVGLPRTCKWVIHGRRCSRPVSDTARGNLKVRSCPDHVHCMADRATASSVLAKLDAPEVVVLEPVAQAGGDVVRVDVVQGWPLAVVQGPKGEEALIEDEELGRRLGYERPRAVRDLIGKLFSDSEVRRVARQTSARGGRPSTACLLTRAQALKVVMRSETPKADELQDAIIAVFMAWQDGKLAPVARSSSVDLAPFMAGLAEATAQIGALVGSVAALVVECRATNETTRKTLERLLERQAPPAAKATPSDPARGMWGWEDIAREAGLPVSKALAGRSRGLAKLALELAGVWQNPTFGKSGVTSIDDSWAYAPAMLGDVLRPLRTIGAKLTYEMGADHQHTARVNEAYEHARKRLREAFGKGAAA